MVGRQVKALWDSAGLAKVFHPSDLAALKLHVGEPGTKTFISPAIAKALVRCMASTGAKPFLTDTAVLYRSQRDNAVEHARVAQNHGFGITSMGAPFIPADGLMGDDEIELEVNGKHYEKVTIASGILRARSMLVLSHATGHLGTGLGGALKNLGMGCASKKAKLVQHYGQQPRIKTSKCIACGECEPWCPADAITVEESAAIDPQECIGCGECVAICREGAVVFDWTILGAELQERMVEHAAAVAKAKTGRICYVTAAQGITKDCDCLGVDQQPLVEDIGLLASFDPVAIDRAVLDLIKERAGQTLEAMSYPKVDGSVQLRHAEALGMGEGDYELVPVDL